MFTPSMDRFQPPDERLGPECDHANCAHRDEDLGTCTLCHPEFDEDECVDRQDVCPKCHEPLNGDGRCEGCDEAEDEEEETT